MTFMKAYRRYPNRTEVMYIGEKTFEQLGIHYGFEHMDWIKTPITKGSIGTIDGLIFDKNNSDNVIGVEVLFRTLHPMELAFDPIALYFGEDLFVRTF